MSADDTKSDVMKAIDGGACDYWIKPLSENLIQNMWQHVARKMWIENKYLQFSEKLEVEVGMKKGERYDSKLPLIDPKIEVINSNAKQESVEKNNDNILESSTKKTRFKWSSELDKKFISVVMELNADSMILSQFFFFSLIFIIFFPLIVRIDLLISFFVNFSRGSTQKNSCKDECAWIDKRACS
jgi:two-component response regulator (ARR-B family)